MKSIPPNRPRLRFDRLILFAAFALLAASTPGCKTIGSKAKGRASNFVCKSDFAVVKGEFDAGVTVGLTVKNVGESGFISIKPELSTSEGEWSRSQDLQFSAGETKTLTYFFEEPTVNATNIQCSVDIYPKAAE